MSDGAGIWSHMRLRLLRPQCPEDYQCNPHILLCMQRPLRVHLLSSILYFYKSACMRVCVCALQAQVVSGGGNGRQFFSVGTDVAILGARDKHRGRNVLCQQKSSIWR